MVDVDILRTSNKLLITLIPSMRRHSVHAYNPCLFTSRPGRDHPLALYLFCNDKKVKSTGTVTSFLTHIRRSIDPSFERSTGPDPEWHGNGERPHHLSRR